VSIVREEFDDDNVVFYGLNDEFRVSVGDVTITKQHPLFLIRSYTRVLNKVIQVLHNNLIASVSRR